MMARDTTARAAQSPPIILTTPSAFDLGKGLSLFQFSIFAEKDNHC
jgi:hypothetical protein